MQKEKIDKMSFIINMCLIIIIILLGIFVNTQDKKYQNTIQAQSNTILMLSRENNELYREIDSLQNEVSYFKFKASKEPSTTNP